MNYLKPILKYEMDTRLHLFRNKQFQKRQKKTLNFIQTKIESAMQKEKSPFDGTENKVSEPTHQYSGSKKITISNTLNESADNQLFYWAKLTPEQRFESFYELMHRFYDFSKHTWIGKKIIIDKYC
jgi:hypothetical protein